MHRSYQPILPCGSKYLQQKWDKAAYEEHKRKIQTTKPVVDTSTPRTYGHLHLKLRKLKLEKDRLSIIERENRLLLEKMSCIMRTKGRTDNKNEYEAKSLNRERREREFRKVSQENHAILERIMNCKPRYTVQKWNEEWQKAENYMNSIARYPRGLCKLQDQKELKLKKTTAERDRKKKRDMKDRYVTNKVEEPEEEELIHQIKKPSNDHEKENPVEKV
ncbi:uncharacterized protein CFAP97D2 isoform X2 [Zootoca vivipara]|uniref:uncharacterized protein CFAP97D2 isoform X2 n=1 Tax=Zootoca vivipara TaxID=8524 RepID=UPI00293BFD0A|nr:uncharacterized protein CFAP97D2 isoform X2 [Zootoca vivipara]